ncbi:hypothetical protein F5884DRAFT_745433 [Xylogone sp. PMI_703]|nr:hypothetical protein F5884DRAFT_745433 [Xylogone sp. PMI_703]
MAEVVKKTITGVNSLQGIGFSRTSIAYEKLRRNHHVWLVIYIEIFRLASPFQLDREDHLSISLSSIIRASMHPTESYSINRGGLILGLQLVLAGFIDEDDGYKAKSKYAE